MNRKGFALALLFALTMLFGCSNDDNEATDAVGEVIDAVKVTPEVTSCADGLVLWEEYNVCAPRVDECENPWELPLIGGGCVAIGPRGCPKLWDPDSDVDCEPGELMDYDGSACPEGFVLTEDEVACIPFFEENCGEMEIPVLGGGCMSIGPAIGADGLTGESGEKCGPGNIPLTQGGCLHVGPRACPNLWAPEQDKDCLIGQVLPCPEGWFEASGGLYCEPTYAMCSHGELAILGGGCERLLPTPEECPASTYPEIVPGAEIVVYVSANSTCTQGCGAQNMPFPSLQAAVNSVPEGAYVLVGEGVYSGQILIDKSIHIIGACSSTVVLTGVCDLVNVANGKVPSAGIAIVDTHDVELAGLTVAAPAAGVAVVNSKEVVLKDVDVVGSVGVGLFASGGAQVRLERVWLHDTLAGDGPGLDGLGIWLTKGAAVEAERSLIEAVLGSGVYASDSGTTVGLTDTSIRATGTNANGYGGYGLRVKFNAVGTLERTVLEDNCSAGAFAASKAGLSLSQSVIRGTKPGDANWLGLGIGAIGGSTVQVSQCMLEDNAASGISIGQSGTQALVERSVVRAGSEATLGDGVSVELGATVVLNGSAVEGCTKVGVISLDAGSKVIMAGTVVRDIKAGTVNDSAGVAAFNGGALELSGCVVEETVGIGVTAIGPESIVEIEDSVVRNTVPAQHGEAVGVQAGLGGSLTLDRMLLEGNAHIAVGIYHEASSATIQRTIIADSVPDATGEFGLGMQVSEQGVVTVSHSLLSGNSDSGIGVFHEGTFAKVIGVVVRNTLPTAENRFGRGVRAGGGSTTVLRDCVIEGNADVGVAAFEKGTQIDIANTLVRNTKPAGSGFGKGVLAVEGSGVTVSDSLIEGNTEAGIVGLHSGTNLVVQNSVILDTKPDANFGLGRGIHAGGGCHVSVSGTLVAGNVEAGVVGFLPGTDVVVRGSLVRGTVPDANGQHGYGMIFGDGATAEVQRSLVIGNSTVGVAIFGESSSLMVVRTAILDTRAAGANINPSGGKEFQVFGDGMMGGDGASVSVSDSIVSRNDRCGAYLERAVGNFENCLVDGNSSFGLALEACVDGFQFEELGNFVIGNGLDLPPGSEQVTRNPSGLPVPSMPKTELALPDV